MHDSVPEYVDWIDRRGRVIGCVDKNFAHEHGLLHPAVHIFVVDSGDRLILQYRAGTKKIYPHHWDTSVGGHVRAGEDWTRSARRELYEELGVRPAIHFLGFTDVTGTEKKFRHVERVYLYCAKLAKGMRIAPNEEFEDVARVPLTELRGFMRTHAFTPMFKKGWNAVGKKVRTTLRLKN